MQIVPRFPPRSSSARNTPNVCMVNGTAYGTVTQAHSAIRAANSAMRTKSYALLFITKII